MTDALDDNEEATALAAEYALGLLTEDEAAAFEAAMAVDPDLRDIYALWATDFVSVADGIHPVPPPQSVLERINADLFPVSAANKPSLLARLGLLPAALTGLVAAATVLVVVNLDILRPAPTAFAPEYAAQVTAEDQSLVVLAAYDADTKVLRLDRSAGAAPTGRSLELWLVVGDAAPVSLGVLADASATEITLPDDLAAGIPDGILAISDEPLGGSPTGSATGPVVAVGAVTRL